MARASVTVVTTASTQSRAAASESKLTSPGYPRVSARTRSALGSITDTWATSGSELNVRTCFDPQYPAPTTPTRRPDDSM
jgi:hypothetical protein